MNGCISQTTSQRGFFFNLHLKMREMEELRAWSESDDISVKNNKHIYLEITAETTMP